MSQSLARIFAILALPLLAACAGSPRTDDAPAAVPGYEGIQDGEFFIEPVPERFLAGGNQKQEVAFAGDEAPGTVVVDTFARKLYFVMEGGRAMSYPIAVGREGLSFRGTGVVGRKAEWPSWQPTANMIRTRPDLYAAYAGGLPGGLQNPLGARALYLYRGGRDTMFRIHGTSDAASVGYATSAGCIRLFNQDAIDLYNRVPNGARVKVRTEAESLAAEGPQMEDAYGRVVPATPENMTKKEKDLVLIARQAEKDRAAAEKADRKRLAACKRRGITPDDCPGPELPDAVVTVGTSDTSTNG
ncbi:L,D-transpeptidase [Tabrizicola piscis]|uniref:L,D-transpeptidase n=1 Tax=Tabrizicola piscis TaxID=2494374 RepID=A0A3S8U6B5_9RHOB|nr:L,D-transpeptidase [Tabrizicola piscis]AZL59060.1 L,D-transpeptidase [Tabrizicola piscis]